MEIIKKIDKVFLDLFGYQNIENKNYVLSKYVIKHKFNDKILIFNSLTSEFICCDNEDEISEKFKIEHWYKIPSELDSYTFADLIKSHKKNIHKYTPLGKVKKVVIFTTTDCNARCYYCFEKGIKKIPMSDKTAEDIADYLISKGNEYVISWFGGEPLYNSKVIDIITDKLRQNNVFFKSDITTNGYLLDNFSINKLKYKWNVISTQITLDGTQDIYNKIKNYIDKEDKNPFQKVLDNIFYISENGIYTKIRYNLSTSNVEDIHKLIKEIKDSPRFNKNIHMYSSRLNREPENTIEEEIQLCKSEIDTNKYILDIIGSQNTKMMFLKYNDEYCLADAGNCFVINPLGELGRCEHYSFNHQLYFFHFFHFRFHKRNRFQQRL